MPATPRKVKVTARRTMVARKKVSVSAQGIQLSARDTKRVLKDIANPPQPNEALKKAVARYKQIIGNDR